MAAVDYSGFRWNQSHKFYNPYVGKGAVLFTGKILFQFTKLFTFLAINLWTFDPYIFTSTECIFCISKLHDEFHICWPKWYEREHMPLNHGCNYMVPHCKISYWPYAYSFWQNVSSLFYSLKYISLASDFLDLLCSKIFHFSRSRCNPRSQDKDLKCPSNRDWNSFTRRNKWPWLCIKSS